MIFILRFQLLCVYSISLCLFLCVECRRSRTGHTTSSDDSFKYQMLFSSIELWSAFLQYHYSLDLFISPFIIFCPFCIIIFNLFSSVCGLLLRLLVRSEEGSLHRMSTGGQSQANRLKYIKYFPVDLSLSLLLHLSSLCSSFSNRRTAGVYINSISMDRLRMLFEEFEMIVCVQGQRVGEALLWSRSVFLLLRAYTAFI